MKILETDRLLLRIFEITDCDAMTLINQDPKVMEYYPSIQDLETTKNFITKVNNHFDKNGYSLYACIRKDRNEFIGFESGSYDLDHEMKKRAKLEAVFVETC